MLFSRDHQEEWEFFSDCGDFNRQYTGLIGFQTWRISI